MAGNCVHRSDVTDWIAWRGDRITSGLCGIDRLTSLDAPGEIDPASDAGIRYRNTL